MNFGKFGVCCAEREGTEGNHGIRGPHGRETERWRRFAAPVRAIVIGEKGLGPEKGPVKRSFRNKSAGGPTVLVWNDIWVTDVIQRKDSAA